MKKFKFFDSTIENPLVKMALSTCFILAILSLILFLALIPTGNKTALGASISVSMLSVSFLFLIMGTYIFIKNIKMYNNDKKSVLLNFYGTNSREEGPLAFVINQGLCLVMIGTGAYIMYLFSDLLISILSGL